MISQCVRLIKQLLHLHFIILIKAQLDRVSIFQEVLLDMKRGAFKTKLLLKGPILTFVIKDTRVCLKTSMQ